MYIITSQAKKKLICTENFNDAYDFICRYQDARVRTLDYTAKPKIMNKSNFLINFYKNTNDTVKFFRLAEVMVIGENNLNDLLNLLKLKKEYLIFKKLDRTHL